MFCMMHCSDTSMMGVSASILFYLLLSRFMMQTATKPLFEDDKTGYQEIKECPNVHSTRPYGDYGQVSRSKPGSGFENYMKVEEKNGLLPEQLKSTAMIQTGSDLYKLNKTGEVTFFFWCPQLGYGGRKVRWSVSWIFGKPKLIYERLRNIDDFTDQKEWGSNPIDYAASFQFNVCKDNRLQQMVCRYRFNGTFEGSMYTHISVATLRLITQDGGDGSRNPHITEVCDYHYRNRKNAVDYCPSRPGKSCKIYHTRFRQTLR